MAIESNIDDIEPMKIVDINNESDVARIAEEVHASNEPRLLRRNGRDLAIIRPIDAGVRGDFDHARKLAVQEALLHSAGGWDGVVDVAEFHEDNRESRRISSRSPVSL